MKKLLASILSATMALSVVAGCTNHPSSSQAQTSSDTATSQNAKKENVTLRVSWWGGDDRHKPTLEAIDAFKKKFDYIKIEPEYSGWDGHAEKITTQITGGTAPDVMQVNYDWLGKLSKDGSGFYDLNKVKNIIKLDNWSETDLKFGTRNGVLNAIPVSTTGRSLFFNKSTFDKLGASIPKTWDDFFALGEKFKKQEGYYPFDLDTGSGFTAWYLAVVYMQQKTGKTFMDADGKIGFTVDEIAEGLDFYKKLEDTGVIRKQKARADEAGTTALYQTPSFISGNVAGFLEWGSSVGKFEQVLTQKNPADQLVLADLPMLSGAKSTGWFQKPSLLFAINAKTSHAEESATFLEYLLNDPEAAKILGTTRGIPSSKAAAKALKDAGKLSGLAYDATVQITNCKPVVISPYMENSEVKEAYNTAIENVSYGKQTTKEAAQEMFDTLQSTLKKVVS